jgi:hypothetical protein
MLQWSRLHPYNAVHVVQVSTGISPQDYREGIESVLRQCSLGLVSISDNQGSCHFHPDHPPIPPRVIGENELEAEIERQLNEPFPLQGRFLPFRFFCGPGADGTTFLGIAYFHALADADSISRLLLEISGVCTGRPLSRESRLALNPGTGLKAPMGNPWETLQRSIGAVRQFQRMRGSHRPPSSSEPSAHNQFRARALTRVETSGAVAKAKRWQVTLNDLCLAALLLAVAPLTARRFLTSRPALTAACVVNLRGTLRPADRNRFGLCLGSFSVTHAVPQGISLRDLARDIGADTRRIKKERLSLGAALTFRASRFMLSRLPLEKQRNFYRKSYPVWGSITNFRVDDLCNTRGATEVIDYLRAVSAGPAMPFVISITGIAGRLNLGISSKPNVIGADKMDGVIQRFVALLTAPEEGLSWN